MTDSIVDYAILIMLFILLLGAWLRQSKLDGKENPMGTKKLNERVQAVDRQVKSLETDVEGIKQQLADVATTKDVIGMKNELEQRIDGHHRLAMTTKASVDRIERILIEKAFKND